MAHVAFTLSVQAVMGAFALLTIGRWFGLSPLAGISTSGIYAPLLWVMVALAAFGLFKLNMHLGRPHRFYRGFYNLKWSPVSREIAGVSVFFGSLVAHAFFALFDGSFAAVLRELFAATALLGLGFGGYYMYKLYRIPARPHWNHWHTAASFIGTGLMLGGALIGLAALLGGAATPWLLTVLSSIMLAGLLLESAGLLVQWREQHAASSEAAVSWLFMTTTYGYTFQLRLALMGVAAALLALVPASAPFLPQLAYLAPLFGLAALAVFTQSLLGRALFYAVVVPTTMPGAYFWKNPGFVEHAREVGLAERPQLGVAYEQHHKFDMAELLKTIRETTWQEKWDPFKRIFTG